MVVIGVIKQGAASAGGRMTQVLAMLVAMFVTVMLLATPVAGEQPLPACSILEDWKLPPLPGQLAVANRVFAPPTSNGLGLDAFNPNVAEFATAELAAAAWPVLMERMRTSPIGSEREGVGTSIRDESIVFDGTVTSEGITFVAAQLLFRDGRYVHSWQALAVQGDPVPLMLDAVRHLLAGREVQTGTPVPVTAADLPRLFAQLPGVDDVPDGLELVREGCGVRRTTDAGLATPSVGQATSRSGPAAYSGENR